MSEVVDISLSNLDSSLGVIQPRILYSEASVVAQMVKNLPLMQETWVQSQGLEDPLEKGMATHSTILDWRIPCTEEPGLWGLKESDTTEATQQQQQQQ